MDKEGPTTGRDPGGIDVAGVSSRPKTNSRMLLYGALAGMAVAVLNLDASGNSRLLFNFLDAPLAQAIDRFELPDAVVMMAVFGYWIAIGLFLARLFCAVRAGTFHGVTRDRILPRALFYGAVGGLVVGGLNYMAGLNQWQIYRDYFQALDRPLELVLEAVDKRFHLSDVYLDWLVAILIYWAIIGLLLGFIFCLIRTGLRRRDGDVISLAGPGGAVEGSKFP